MLISSGIVKLFISLVVVRTQQYTHIHTHNIVWHVYILSSLLSYKFSLRKVVKQIGI